MSKPKSPIHATATLLAVLGAGLTASYAAPPAPAPHEEEAPAMADLVRSWTRPIQFPPRMAQGLGTMTRTDALVSLSSGERAHGCATPLMMALSQHEGRLNHRSRMLLDRAAGVSPAALSSSLPSAGGEFRIHYTTQPSSADRVDTTDLDRSGAPDGVERLASDLSDVLADFVQKMSWPLPSTDVVDVYLVGLAGTGDNALEGFTRPMTSSARPGAVRRALEDAAAEAPEGVASAIFLSTALARPGATARPALAHQIAHVLQARESSRESIWWHESSALYLENHLEGSLRHALASLGARSLRRGHGPEQPSLTLTLEGFLWPHYLVQSSGGDAMLVRRLWDEMAAMPGNNTLEAMDRVLQRTMQSSLAEEIRVFNVWNLFLGEADDGGHYPFAALLPTPVEDAAYEIFPVRGASLNGPIAPMGCVLVRLLGDGSDGGLKIRFEGAGAGRWDVGLLVRAAGSSDVRFVPVELDDTGLAQISVPWRHLAAVELLVQNLSPGTAPADYAFAVEHDPRVPYDLLSFTASPTDQGVSLAWATEDEQRVAGWNVYRGLGPLGPFSRLNPWLVPGGGLQGQPMSYVYVDDTTQPGRKYYYRLEGITFEGFAETSHPAGVRIAPRDSSSPGPSR
ncbi:MAG: hypothetical protein ACREAA_14215 [Candidatus Polarisedimenticolia bacterium]